MHNRQYATDTIANTHCHIKVHCTTQSKLLWNFLRVKKGDLCLYVPAKNTILLSQLGIITILQLHFLIPFCSSYFVGYFSRKEPQVLQAPGDILKGGFGRKSVQTQVSKSNKVWITGILKCGPTDPRLFSMTLINVLMVSARGICNTFCIVQ